MSETSRFRFTLLRHLVGPSFRRADAPQSDSTAAGPVHWDWLFQSRQSALWTWATDPLCSLEQSTSIPFPSETVSALKLADHRSRYLDYEGEIAGDRGTVRQIATGTYQIVCQREGFFEARLTLEASRYFDLERPILLVLKRSQGKAGQSWQLQTMPPEEA